MIKYIVNKKIYKYEKYAWFVPCHSTKISQNLKQLKEMQTRIGAWFPGDFWKY